MSNDKTPEQTLKEALEKHQMYLQNVGNINLNNKILHLADTRDLSNIKESLIEAAKPNFKDLICFLFLETTFDIAFNIHYFHSRPYKVLDFIKVKLFPYEDSLRTLFKTLLLDIVCDNSRFDFTDEAHTYIITELQALDVSNIQVDVPEDITDLEFFIGGKQLKVDKDFMISFFAVRGWLQSKEQYYVSFLREHFSAELLNALRILGFTYTNSNNSFDESSVNRRKIIDIDILELKPNIAGIGVNLNELINRLRKR